MAGLRLQELLKLVYGSNPVTNMLSGESIYIVCGHLLVDAALNAILVANAYNVPVPDKDTIDQPDKKVVGDYPEHWVMILRPWLLITRWKMMKCR